MTYRDTLVAAAIIVITGLWLTGGIRVEVDAPTITVPPPTPQPAIVIQAQEIGVLYCPEGTQVYTSTEGMTGGFRVFCR